MVYRGRPSKACLQCRRRKIRCDLRKDSCGQCIRASLACFGYRDTAALRIEDESQVVRTKSKASSVSSPLRVTIEEQARNVFYNHFVLKYGKTYTILGSLYGNLPPGSPLLASVDAVSLAFFAIHNNRPEAVTVGRKRYLCALPQLNGALCAPGAISDNTIFLAILLLDCYEKLIGINPKSRQGWMSHVNGALALIAMRDPSLLQTDVGLRLSLRLTTALLISCVAAGIPAPPALLSLRETLAVNLGHDPKFRCSSLVINYTFFHQALQERSCTRHDLIKIASGLDEEFQQLVNDMPATWHYETVFVTENSTECLEPFFNTYPSLHITQTWNVIRIMRILLLDTIIQMKTIAIGSQSSSIPTADMIRNQLDLVAAEICASAPQYIPNTRDATTKKEQQRLECYSLIFPLYIAARFARPETRIKAWVLGRLKFLSAELHIRKAITVLNILERSELQDPWNVYAMLGSYAFAA